MVTSSLTHLQYVLVWFVRGLYALYEAIFSLELFKCAYVSRCISNKVNRDLSLFLAPGLCFFSVYVSFFFFFWGGL